MSGVGWNACHPTLRWREEVKGSTSASIHHIYSQAGLQVNLKLKQTNHPPKQNKKQQKEEEIPEGRHTFAFSTRENSHVSDFQATLVCAKF